MINSGIYNYIDILDMAADAANTRNELITNNIANVSTANYKRKDISFEGILQSAMYGSESLDTKVASVLENRSDYQPLVYTDNANLSYRKDGNNVDINTEEAYLAENQIRYNALVDQMSQEFSRFKTVLSQ